MITLPIEGGAVCDTERTLGRLTMRPLDEEETKAVFEKLYQYVGKNIKHLIERPAVEGKDDDGRYCFRLQKNRVYYVSEVMSELH